MYTWYIYTYIHIYIYIYIITFVGEPHIQEPLNPAQALATSITLTCGQNFSIGSLVYISVIIFLCNISNGAQPLTWNIYKDGELTQYTSTNVNSYTTISSPTDSDFGTYTFVLSSAHCGSAMKISRLVQCKFL